jgi:AhpD family alkylhydroperoxidase
MRNLKAGIVASVIGGLMAGQIVSAQQAPETEPTPQVADKTDKTKTTTPTPPTTPKTTTTTTTTTPTSTDAVLKDIEATVGFVPQFFRQIADTQLESFWASMKTFEMNPNTALDAKTKELIGLAVAAQIPCDYCIEFHTLSAKKNGATDQEIREAVGMAAMTRLGSTVLNGIQTDRAQFKADLRRMNNDTTPKKRQATR